MTDKRSSLAMKFAILVLLVAAVPATAAAFCFSFGSKSNGSARYSSYPPPYPGVLVPAYPGYGYSPVLPAYNHGGIYYPPPLPYTAVPSEFIRR
ncbi:MAG: hypothetical protein KAJ65_03905 [Gammaproteobacteria bacterium]|jgi:hypothetical protein|nr:hypothetical protein [Gammaproteobacteria bacterium]